MRCQTSTFGHRHLPFVVHQLPTHHLPPLSPSDKSIAYLPSAMATVPSKRKAVVDITEQIAVAKARAADLRARLEAQNAAQGGASLNGNPSAAAPSPIVSAAASGPKDQAQLARERVNALRARISAARSKDSAPPTRPPAQPANSLVERDEDGDVSNSTSAAVRGGLSIEIHPALLGEIPVVTSRFNKGQRAAKAQPPKEKTVENPYLEDAALAQPRRARPAFVATHTLHDRPAMHAANEARKKDSLAALQKRIQASASKVGLEHSTEAQTFAIPAPPDIEFWDEGLEDDDAINQTIDSKILHPILIAPPQERLIVLKEPTLKLTAKEQKKVRRMRRQDNHKEEQDKIRLGLIPPPAPKLTHNNVMRVHGELAVKDPTAVAAMVNAQIKERRDTHEATNEARKLTKEERAAKREKNAAQNAAMGLTLSAYKIDFGKDKLHSKHKYKVDMNARQYHDLTGMIIVAKSFCLVIVEAGDYSTRKFKHLLLNRIPWQLIIENDGNLDVIDNKDEDGEQQNARKDTTCTELWNGQIRDHKFKKWGSFREVDTDEQAKEVLVKLKLEHFWNMAKSNAL